AGLLLLDVAAGRIVGAGGVLAEASVLDREVLAALRARLLERDVRLRFDFPLGADGDAPRRLAAGIAGASEERAEPPALEHHVAAALGAALLRSLEDLGRFALAAGSAVGL